MKKVSLLTLAFVSSFILAACGADTESTSNSGAEISASIEKSTEKAIFSQRAGDRCPLKDGEEYASSPSYAAGEIFRIMAEAGLMKEQAISDCRKCARAAKETAISAGLTVQGNGPMAEACEALIVKYRENWEAWVALRQGG